MVGMIDAIEVIMNLFTKFRRFVSYHVGPKEVVYENELNSYLPKNVLDLDFMMYVVDKKNINGVPYYTVLVNSFMESNV